MGVRIIAYSDLWLLPPHAEAGAWCKDADHIAAFAYAGQVRSFEGLADPDVVFSARTAKFVGGRCYARTDETREHEILSMNYTGYNMWRETLCRSALGVDPSTIWDARNTDRDAYRDSPFIDVIDFADNEGCIGSVGAARLLRDFTAEGARGRFADAVSPDDARWFLPAWDGWVVGLALAVQDGLVQFR